MARCRKLELGILASKFERVPDGAQLSLGVLSLVLDDRQRAELDAALAASNTKQEVATHRERRVLGGCATLSQNQAARVASQTDSRRPTTGRLRHAHCSRRGMIRDAVRVMILALLTGCGATVDSPAASGGELDPTPPSYEVPEEVSKAVPDGDCQKPVSGEPVPLFSPWSPNAEHLGGNLYGGGLVRSGRDVYASLMTSSQSKALTIYKGSTSVAGTWRPYAKEVMAHGMKMGDRLYWGNRADGNWSQSSEPTFIAQRGADERPSVIPNTRNHFSFAVDGTTAFTFDHEWCPTTVGCRSPEIISSVDLRTGQTLWSQRFDRLAWSPITDDESLYWYTDPDSASQVQRTRIFHMPKRGGEITELPIELDLSVVQLARDEEGLVILGYGVRDAERAADIIRYSVPLPPNSTRVPTRSRLQRTYVGTYSVFDRSSIYFTYEGPLDGEPRGSRNQTQTLMRVCKDGSNPTIVLEGVSINAASSHPDRYSIRDLAIDAKRIYFTSNNGVYAIDK